MHLKNDLICFWLLAHLHQFNILNSFFIQIFHNYYLLMYNLNSNKNRIKITFGSDCLSSQSQRYPERLRINVIMNRSSQRQLS